MRITPVARFREQIDGTDPARKMDGVPPNVSQYAVPHIWTMQGLISSISRTYRISDEALRDGYENAKFMDNDCGLRECLDARWRSVALLNWHLEPENPKAPLQKKLCDDLTAILKRIPRFMQFRESLQHATWIGRAAIQSRYGRVVVENEGRFVPVGWKPIHGDKLVFKWDDDEAVGIRVGSSAQVGTESSLPKDYADRVEQTERGRAYFLKPDERKLLTLHKHQIEDGYYDDPASAGKIHGVGIRSRIYWNWYQQQETLAWLMEFLERSAFGIELWRFPMGNPAAEAAARKAAEERIGLGRNVVLVPIPGGEQGDMYGVDRIEPGLAGAAELKSIINDYFGHRIKRYILGQTLTSEADATGLGSNLADVHLATFLDIVKYDALNLEETITEDLVKWLKYWNFPSARGVHVRFVIDTESQDSDRKLEAAERAWQMGCRIKESDIMDLIGFSLPTEDDVVLPSPNQQQGMGMPGMGQPGAGPQPQKPFAQQLAESVSAAMGQKNGTFGGSPARQGIDSVSIGV